MAKISILVCSRISGNKNFGLPNLLDSLQRMSSNCDNFEVLVKFDSDDQKVPGVLPKLTGYPFKIKYVIEPRGRGYLDLHVSYNRLFSKADAGSIIIGAMADDFVITQRGWDEKTGAPTRKKLEELDLKDVADKLSAARLLPG